MSLGKCVLMTLNVRAKTMFVSHTLIFFIETLHRHWLGLCKFARQWSQRQAMLLEGLDNGRPSHTFVFLESPIDHTFRTSENEFGCEDSPGDFIDDTPAHQGDSMIYDCRGYLPPFGLETPPDTCPGLPGRDPVFNYM